MSEPARKPSIAALEAARTYLYVRLGRPPYPPDIETLARIMDNFLSNREPAE